MADIVVTPANVAKGTGATVNNNLISGEAIIAGQTVYQSTSDNKVYKADNNDTAAKAVVFGIALNSTPGANQPISVQTAGIITIGGTTADATFYFQSDTAGGICPFADIVTAGMYNTLIGWGISATQIQLAIQATGRQVPA